MNKDTASMPEGTSDAPAAIPHQRRKRYSGKNPRRFADKYKEHAGDAETIAKVTAGGKTPAGTHRPIMVTEILAILDPKPGEVAADCTLGFGGHARALLSKILPGGRLLGLDADPLELPRTEARLRAAGFDETVFSTHRSNFGGLPQILAAQNLPGADIILADLGVSSMQIDDPTRGFSMKQNGPLDMRMNPNRGQPASVMLKNADANALQTMLEAYADEPNAAALAAALAGGNFSSTMELARAVGAALPRAGREDAELTVRRVFQALRIAVNDELSALDTFLRNLPHCLVPRGRVAVLTFHSGEDRRVKKSFEANYHAGLYVQIADEVGRPGAVEQIANPRSTSAKLRWAIRAH